MGKVRRGSAGMLLGSMLVASGGGFALGNGVAWAASPDTALQAASAASVFGSAYKATESAKTAQVTLTIGGSEAVSGVGACKFKVDYCNYVLKLSIPSSTGGAATIETADEIVDGTELYIKFADHLGGTAAKPWTEESTAGSGATSTSEDQDPSQALDLLEKYATGVTKIGSADVGGVSTTEYSANVDPKNIKGATAEQKSVGVIPLKVWIDGKHRLIQLGETIAGTASPATSSSAASSGAINVSIGFSHYGEAVKVSVPPPSEVTPT